MNYYGKAVTSHLTAPRTLEELVDLTDLQPKHIILGIQSAREDGWIINARVGVRTDEGYEPTTYALEDRTHAASD